MDVRLKGFRFEGGELLNCRILGEYHGRNPVHADIRGLSRKDGRYQELPSTLVSQCTGDVGISLIEAAQDFIDPFGSSWIVAAGFLRHYFRGYAFLRRCALASYPHGNALAFLLVCA